DPAFAPLVKPQEWLAAARTSVDQDLPHWQMSLIITRLLQFDYDTLKMTTAAGDSVTLPPRQYYRVREPPKWLNSAGRGLLLQGFPSTPPEEDRPSRQGYLRDGAVRRAIERRAMEAAIAHYRGQGYRVENTSDSHPYDLCCRRATEVVRVEVKGS